MANTNNKRPVGLIQNTKLAPTQSAENSQTIVKRAPKKSTVTKNQDSNIKVSRQTKNQIDILMKLTDNKFAYEMIETLIDNYVEKELDPDKRRAFKTLSSL